MKLLSIGKRKIKHFTEEEKAGMSKDEYIKNFWNRNGAYTFSPQFIKEQLKYEAGLIYDKCYKKESEV